ncbi:hypothetical protein IWQ62_004523 [Dispira parvispora]|uniref:DEK-C domain-containing protein n=1 Tax=Dispira parvispora TaxID=1520584 RepID=A0A9W8E1W5_9FUNG|nr:hypothetical protein IWQ62_004523 [Dispira parvispora]
MDTDKLRTACAQLVGEADLNETTARQIRRQLEERLNLDAGTLDGKDYKRIIKTCIEEVINGTYTEKPIPAEPAHVDDENDAEVAPPSRATSPAPTEAASATDGSPNISSAGIPKDTSVDEESELSDVPTTPRPRKKARVVESPAETEKKKPSRKSKEPLSKDEQKIASLKSYIRMCGIRRVWSQDLNGLSPKEQIRKLQQQLQTLGVEGRPTIAKCKQVAYQRELKAECESVAMNPIVEKEDKEKRRTMARRDQSMAALKAKRKSEYTDRGK